ncbi:helix-turn-helix transcriptional regulator [Devosia sp.]|uniref:helix-turn-helix transcriptional regulator n=1 Tax=Devosia sp. TaxID=1871048 RepID=UPI003264C298
MPRYIPAELKGKEAHNLPENLKRLTHREREVFALILEAQTAKETSRALNITVRTAGQHRERVIEKLAARSATDVLRIVREAEHMGLVAQSDLEPRP